MSITDPVVVGCARLTRALNCLIERGGTAMLVRLEQPAHFQRVAATLVRRYRSPALIVCPTAARAYAIRVALARFAPHHTHITTVPSARLASDEVLVTRGDALPDDMTDTVVVSDATAATYGDTFASICTFERAIAATRRLLAFVGAPPWNSALNALALRRRVFVARESYDFEPVDYTRGIPYPTKFARYGATEDRYDEDSWP
jgi:hypothetical protein